MIEVLKIEEGENKLIRKGLVLGIVFLFFVSLVFPVTNSFSMIHTDKNKIIDEKFLVDREHNSENDHSDTQISFEGNDPRISAYEKDTLVKINYNYKSKVNSYVPNNENIFYAL
jgi:hypothetical protein